MKKILFTLLLVAGSFLGQAQTDTISYFSFKSDASQGFGDLGHSFSEEFTHCSDNVVDASNVIVYTWNNDARQLSTDGSVTATYSSFTANFIRAAFARENNDLLTRNRFGGIEGTIPTTASGSSLTR